MCVHVRACVHVTGCGGVAEPDRSSVTEINQIAS